VAIIYNQMLKTRIFDISNNNKLQIQSHIQFI